MDDTAENGREAKPVEVVTACGSLVLLSAHTPWTTYHDEKIYFCMPDCLESYEKDPMSSCLAARIFMDRG